KAQWRCSTGPNVGALIPALPAVAHEVIGAGTRMPRRLILRDALPDNRLPDVGIASGSPDVRGEDAPGIPPHDDEREDRRARDGSNLSPSFHSNHEDWSSAPAPPRQLYGPKGCRDVKAEPRCTHGLGREFHEKGYRG